MALLHTSEELEAADALLTLAQPGCKRAPSAALPSDELQLTPLADEAKRPRLRRRKQAHPSKILHHTPVLAPGGEAPAPEAELPDPAPKSTQSKENWTPTFTPGWGTMYYHNQHNIKIHAPVEVTLGPSQQGMVGSIILVAMHADKPFIHLPIQQSKANCVPAFKLTSDHTYETGFYSVPGYPGTHPGYKIYFFTATPQVDLTFTKLSTDEEGTLFRARYWSLVAFRSNAKSKEDIFSTPIQVVKEFRPDRKRQRHKREHLLLDEHCVSSCLDFDTVKSKHIMWQLVVNLIDNQNNPVERHALIDFYKFSLPILPEQRNMMLAWDLKGKVDELKFNKFVLKPSKPQVWVMTSVWFVLSASEPCFSLCSPF